MSRSSSKISGTRSSRSPRFADGSCDASTSTMAARVGGCMDGDGVRIVASRTSFPPDRREAQAESPGRGTQASGGARRREAGPGLPWASAIRPPTPMRRSSLVLLVLLLAACRAEAPREGARSPATGRTSDLSAARTDGCSQTRGQRPDTSIRLGTPAADRWRHAMARGAEYRCVVHPSLTLRLRLVGDTTYPSLDSIVVLPEGESSDVIQVLHREPGNAEMPLPYHADALSTFDL